MYNKDDFLVFNKKSSEEEVGLESFQFLISYKGQIKKQKPFGEEPISLKKYLINKNRITYVVGEYSQEYGFSAEINKDGETDYVFPLRADLNKEQENALVAILQEIPSETNCEIYENSGTKEGTALDILSELGYSLNSNNEEMRGESEKGWNLSEKSSILDYSHNTWTGYVRSKDEKKPDSFAEFVKDICRG